MMSKLVPKLRFKEFSGEWEEKRLEDLGDFIPGLTYSPDDIRDNGVLVLRSSNIQNGKITLEDTVYVQTNIKEDNLSKPNDILICVRNGSKELIGKNALIPHDMPLSTHGAFMTVFRSNIAQFVYQLFQTETYKNQVNADLGATINSINGNNLKKYVFYIPKYQNEQQKIANTLSSLDNLIEAYEKKAKALKKHKKGLMQQLFPQDGEKSPKLRFKGFSGEWEEKRLGDCLDYLQPTKYLVKSTAYSDDYNIPVLTAGKTFILGYTNESDGIFKKDLPVIIFDDFTTATKFVNFPFKVKSSAIKILFAKKNINIKFMYELMQTIQYEVGNHERHWISIFSLLKVYVPMPNEQQKIANTLSSLDNLIEAQEKKIEALKKHKKGLMQQMFVSGEV